MNKNQNGFGLIGILMTVAIVGLVGVAGWRIYQVKQDNESSSPTQQRLNGTSDATDKTAISAEDQTKVNAMAKWFDFNNATIGLKFRYPSEWGQAKFDVMDNIPNATFYKISFSNNVYLTVTPKASLRNSSTTFDNLKDGIAKYPDSRHAFVNESTVVGAIVPSMGNQHAEIGAARLIDISKVNASDIVLSDFRTYGGTCSHESYKSCYTNDELNAYRWLLESVAIL